MPSRGKIKGGAIDIETGAEHPEVADFRIEIEALAPAVAKDRDPLTRMTGMAIETEIPDLATNVSFDLDIDLYGEKVAEEIRATAVYWLTDQIDVMLPPWVRPELMTGFPEVDDRLAELRPKIKGFALKQQIEVFRQVSGEQPVKSVLTSTVGSHQPLAAASADFQVPEDFVYREPVIGLPGR